MHHHYADIRALTDRAPVWFDESAVPRYCDFAPDEGADIYADEIVLLRIKCQACGRPFDVAMSWNPTDLVLHNYPSLEVQIRAGTIGYGDPPNIGCCHAGPRMSSDAVRVLQFWRRKTGGAVRVPELEIALPDGEEA